MIQQVLTGHRETNYFARREGTICRTALASSPVVEVSVRVIVSCPSRSCGRQWSGNGRGRCQKCGAYLIVKPSPRVKDLDLRKMSVVWLWTPDEQGSERIMVYYPELDLEGRTRVANVNQNGRFVRIAPGIIKLHPDMRRVGISTLPFLRNVRDEGICGRCQIQCPLRQRERATCAWDRGEETL